MNYKKETSCNFGGCPLLKWSRGLCNTHYRQQWRGEELRPILHTMQGSTKPMNQIEIAWLAGIIDGEGSFSKNHGSTNSKVIEIRLKSTDEDIVLQCQSFREWAGYMDRRPIRIDPTTNPFTYG